MVNLNPMRPAGRLRLALGVVDADREGDDPSCPDHYTGVWHASDAARTIVVALTDVSGVDIDQLEAVAGDGWHVRLVESRFSRGDVEQARRVLFERLREREVPAWGGIEQRADHLAIHVRCLGPLPAEVVAGIPPDLLEITIAPAQEMPRPV